ncbi:MAG TPA: bifunctional adenosylcobinamide kinase/adenosylcobinamide-phosphate guanylyltransferase [Candidatus Limnocylindria bacterium]
MAELELVLGGTRSGKSRFALARASALGGDRVTFVATARAGDEELDARIADHRRARPAAWRTVEVDGDLAAAVASADPAHVVLLDSLTLWLSARLEASTSPESEWAAVAKAIEKRALAVIVVSDEVGLGIVPATPIGRRFRDELGKLNQAVARDAGSVVLMVAGLPVPLK